MNNKNEISIKNLLFNYYRHDEKYPKLSKKNMITLDDYFKITVVKKVICQ